MRHVWTYTPETEVVADGVVNAAPLRPLNWGPSVETERRGSGLDVVYVGNTISKFLYESYDGATWTEVATPGQVTAMTVGDDGYVYFGSWFEFDSPPEGFSFYRFDGTDFILVDAETEVAWAAVITYLGDILGGGVGSGGVLRLTGTGPADWAFEQFYSSTTGGPVEMILWTR